MLFSYNLKKQYHHHCTCTCSLVGRGGVDWWSGVERSASSSSPSQPSTPRLSSPLTSQEAGEGPGRLRRRTNFQRRNKRRNHQRVKALVGDQLLGNNSSFHLPWTTIHLCCEAGRCWASPLFSLYQNQLLFTVH